MIRVAKISMAHVDHLPVATPEKFTKTAERTSQSVQTVESFSKQSERACWDELETSHIRLAFKNEICLCRGHQSADDPRCAEVE